MISSMDLFFRRDCALGAGPEVELPRAEGAELAFFEVTLVVPVSTVCEVAALALEVLNNDGVAPGAEVAVSVAAGAVVAAVEAGRDVDSATAASVFWAKPPNRFPLGAVLEPVLPKRFCVGGAEVVVADDEDA